MGLSLDEGCRPLDQSLDGYKRQRLREGDPLTLFNGLMIVCPQCKDALNGYVKWTGIVQHKTDANCDVRIEPKFTIEDQEPYGGGWCRCFCKLVTTDQTN